MSNGTSHALATSRRLTMTAPPAPAPLDSLSCVYVFGHIKGSVDRQEFRSSFAPTGRRFPGVISV
jgi:hypothetical protein